MYAVEFRVWNKYRGAWSEWEQWAQYDTFGEAQAEALRLRLTAHTSQYRVASLP